MAAAREVDWALAEGVTASDQAERADGAGGSQADCECHRWQGFYVSSCSHLPNQTTA